MVKYYVDIERPSGTFTAYYNRNVNKSAAQKECAKHGQILAPITEKEDFDAIIEVLSTKNEENLLTGRHLWDYMVGLEVASDNSHRIFTNGVEFDKEKHGSFYKDDDYYELTNYTCPLALLYPRDPTSITVENTWCESLLYSYICFKPKNEPCASSGAIVGGAGVGRTDNRSGFFAGIGVGALIVCAAYFVFTLFTRNKKNCVQN